MRITDDLLRELPKTELHVHLESTMPGALLGEFAARHGRSLPRPAEELYHCSADNLIHFLAFLDSICAFIQTTEALETVAERVSLESRKEKILCAETILNPSH